jgi:hypothetical protein
MLEQSWRVLHSIRVGINGADIDHLVIGPAGDFTLNAKYHLGASIWVGAARSWLVMVNGQRQPFVRNSQYEARRMGKILSAASNMPVDCKA